MSDAIIVALWAVIELILIVTGRIVVKALTFGRCRVTETNESRIYGAAGAFSLNRGGRRAVTEKGQLFVGMLFYLVLGIGLVAWKCWF